MKILYLTRKYPPMIGGMEKVNFYLSLYFSNFAEIHLISWGKSQKFLPVIIPFFLLKSCYTLVRHKIDIIHLGDGLLSLIGLILKVIFKKPVTATLHGLDITFPFALYQLIVPNCVKRLDRIVCISNRTKEECIRRDVVKEKILVIPNGIEPRFFQSNKEKTKFRAILSKKIGIEVQNKKVLLSVGRLVKRKGFDWFTSKVFKEISSKKDFIYLIVGDGPLEKELRESIRRNNLEEKVLLLGKISEEDLKILYNSSDMLIMPNIPVEGDIEGFGLVILEANSAGLPVVASRIDGIKEVIINGKNGLLVEPYDVKGFAQKISSLLDNDDRRKKIGNSARNFVLMNFNWKKIAEMYRSMFKEVI